MIRRRGTDAIPSVSENTDSTVNPSGHSLPNHFWDDINFAEVLSFFRAERSGSRIQHPGSLPHVWQSATVGADVFPETQFVALADVPTDVQGLEQRLQDLIALHGFNHIDVVRARIHLGLAYRNTGNLDAAAMQFNNSLMVLRNLEGFGPDSQLCASTEGLLADVRIMQGDYGEAQRLLEDELRILGLPGNRDLPTTAFYRERAERALAVANARIALAIALANNPPDGLLISDRRRNLAVALLAWGDPEGAEQAIEQALRGIERCLGRQDPEFALALAVRATALERQGYPRAAITSLEQAVAILRNQNANGRFDNQIREFEDRIGELRGQL
jgi:tetratricopeptide (TPR) repeat protein